MESICARVAAGMVANGCRPPRITDRWRRAARLLLDHDRRPLAEVLQVVDWCQADPFWRANILSPGALRARYDQLRLAAKRPARISSTRGAANPVAGATCREHRGQPAHNCGICRAMDLAVARR